MPSRVAVTSATSATLYSAIRSYSGTCARRGGVRI